MKVTLNSTELKHVLKVVKAIADSNKSKAAASHTLCTLKVWRDTPALDIRFILNGAMLRYSFKDFSIDEATGEVAEKTLDLSVFTTLKLPGKALSLSFGSKSITFQSGRVRGELMLTQAHVEDILSQHAMPQAEVELTHSFPLRSFISGLSSHCYGYHHNPLEADKRQVHVFAKGSDENLYFVSQDRLVTANTVKYCNKPSKVPFNQFFLPKPLKAILSSLPAGENPDFAVGATKSHWRIVHSGVDILFPNIVSGKDVGVDKFLSDLELAPGFNFNSSLASMLDMLSFFKSLFSSSTLVSKGDNPIISLTVREGSPVFTADTEGAKGMEFTMEGVQVDPGGYEPHEAGELLLGFKFIQDFVSSMKSDLYEKSRVEDPTVSLKWWPNLHPKAPIQGKIISVAFEDSTYLMLRVKKV